MTIHDHDITMTQHGLASYVTKFEIKALDFAQNLG